MKDNKDNKDTVANIGEFWINKDEEVIKITNVIASDDYPIKGKTKEDQGITFTKDGNIFMNRFAYEDHQKGLDLWKKILPEKNPEYFL